MLIIGKGHAHLSTTDQAGNATRGTDLATRTVAPGVTKSPLATTDLRWSDQTVRFSREDHPRIVPRPGHTPMVLKAQIAGYDVG
jgi:hypothetical protein